MTNLIYQVQFDQKAKTLVHNCKNNNMILISFSRYKTYMLNEKRKTYILNIIWIGNISLISKYNLVVFLFSSVWQLKANWAQWWLWIPWTTHVALPWNCWGRCSHSIYRKKVLFPRRWYKAKRCGESWKCEVDSFFNYSISQFQNSL